MGNENELGEDRSNEGGEGEGLCGSWGQKVRDRELESVEVVKYL